MVGHSDRRGSRGWGVRPSAWRCVLGGVAIGLAVVARPYDAALFATPVMVWALIRLRRQIVRPVGWYVVGALPPIVATLLYDWAATGSPLRLPFNLLEPADRPGFGPRRMFPQEPYHAFGLHSGIRGSASHLLLTVLWVGGGPALVLLALVGIWRRRRSAPALMLAAVAVAFPVGYVFFWGAWNASKLWHGVRFIGPFYFLPMVIPIAAFGGAELVALYRRWRPGAAVVVLVGLVSSVLVAAPAVAADARWSRQDGAVLAMVAAPRRRVVARPGPHPGGPGVRHAPDLRPGQSLGWRRTVALRPLERHDPGPFSGRQPAGAPPLRVDALWRLRPAPKPPRRHSSADSREVRRFCDSPRRG